MLSNSTPQKSQLWGHCKNTKPKQMVETQDNKVMLSIWLMYAYLYVKNLCKEMTIALWVKVYSFECMPN